MKTNKRKSLTSDFLNIIGMVILGITVAVLIYPFLHEAGHSLAAFLVGAEVVEVEILPLPYVMCNVASLTNGQQIAIGVSGMLFPLLITVLIPRKWFWSWYVRFVLLFISFLAFAISAVTLILPNGATINPQDDMLRVVSLLSGSEMILKLCLIVGIALIVVLTILDRPAKTIYRKFGV